MTSLEVEDKIKNAKPIDFGNLINDVFELFKKIWLKGFITIFSILASSHFPASSETKKFNLAES